MVIAIEPTSRPDRFVSITRCWNRGVDSSACPAVYTVWHTSDPSGAGDYPHYRRYVTQTTRLGFACSLLRSYSQPR